MAARTPLAWKNLTHDRRRLAVAVSGVGFAAVLIFMQLGFLNALLESTVQVLRRLNGELVIISSAKYALPARERFDLRRVQQVQGIPGVAGVAPIYMESLGAVLRTPSHRGYPIRVLAYREEDHAFALPAVREHAEELHRPGTALADLASCGKYGIPPSLAKLPEFQGELT
ncbi:MAG TPA: hypothetical protein VL096_19615, partial [Pirellulaceae bacterium]|nr:hypothetical protein [Pirellulaceae bacterium]